MFDVRRFSVIYGKGVIIPVLFFIVLLVISRKHTLFSEWDGVMQYLSSVEINSAKGYHGMSAHFWPPLYATLIWALTFVSRDGFVIAKFISILASCVLLFIIYHFLYKLIQNEWAALLAQLFVATNPVYFSYSIEAQNMMLDALFYVSTICMFFEALQLYSYRYFFLTGLIAGLAGLTRYTSYTVVPAFMLLLILFYKPKVAFRAGTFILSGFILISIPWWIINTLNSGGPVNNWHYLNIGAGMASESPIKVAKWWWHDQATYYSTWDIIRASPAKYFVHILQNIGRSLYIVIVNSSLAFIICLVLFSIQNSISAKSQFLITSNKFFFIIFFCFVTYIAAISQAFIYDRLFLGWYALIIIASVVALHTIYNADLRLKKLRSVFITGMIIYLLANILVTTARIKYYLEDNNYNVRLAGNEEIVSLLKRTDKALSQKIVMAIHPARAYYLGSKFVMMPLYYEGDNVDDLVSYKHLDRKIIDYVPRFPSDLDISTQKADYFIFDRTSLDYLPQFSFLFDERSDRIPVDFKCLLHNNNVVLYRITK